MTLPIPGGSISVSAPIGYCCGDTRQGHSSVPPHTIPTMRPRQQLHLQTHYILFGGNTECNKLWGSGMGRGERGGFQGDSTARGDRSACGVLTCRGEQGAFTLVSGRMGKCGERTRVCNVGEARGDGGEHAHTCV